MTEETLIKMGEIGHELLLMALFIPLICVIILGCIYAIISRID